jgi:DNA-binding response OmpR family regulator
MTVLPSCPALVIHDDDAFRRKLIATLDEKHFTVTFSTDGDDALKLLADRSYRVVLVGVDLARRKGLTALDFLRDHRDPARCGVIILGDPNPDLRAYAPWADETLLKPVDAGYVADRARTYCNC